MIVHLPTPYDHFSPRTGSAVMTVIDGLARGDQARERHRVLLARGTYSDRYTSADVLEYQPGAWVDGRRARFDAVLARSGVGRPFGDRSYQRALQAAPSEPHALLLHNAPYVGRRAPSQSMPVLYAHNEILPGPRFATARAVGGLVGVIAVSDWLADRLSSRLPRAWRHRVAVILNGVDLDAFDARPRPEEEAVKVLFLGRVIPDKGADVLLEACIRLGHPDLSVRVVGSAGFAGDAPLTAYEAQLRVLAAQSSHPVEFRPFVPRDRIPEEFAWADIVVFPARWNEPFALTLLEALASGAATIISDSGGMPQVAAGSAVLVPRGDVDALAAAIEGLARDRPERERLGRLARTRAESLDWSSRSAELHAVLAGLA